MNLNDEAWLHSMYQKYRQSYTKKTFQEYLTDSLKPKEVKPKRERIGKYSGVSKLRISEGYKK